MVTVAENSSEFEITKCDFEREPWHGKSLCFRRESDSMQSRFLRFFIAHAFSVIA
jgi:hypothetical protein